MMKRLLLSAAVTLMALSVQNALAALHPQWYGLWSSNDGSMDIEITRSDFTFVGSGSYKWTDALEPSPSTQGRFGYSNRRISKAELQERFNRALEAAGRDKAGVYDVPNARRTRRAIDSIQSGVYKILWVLEGDFPHEYILDGDTMIEIQDNMYTFHLRSFSRVPGQ